MAKKLIGHDPDQVPVNGFLGSVAYMDEPELAERIAFIESRKQQIAQSFVQKNAARGDLDVDLAVAIELGLLGAPVAGGFYAGLIDTTKGNIIAADDYQTGLRYALILAPKITEVNHREWDRGYRSDEPGTTTRWNGLGATDIVIAKDDTAYSAHTHIANMRTQYPVIPTPGGSDWYLPAQDELELLYRNFKPNNADNSTSYGDNPSSYPNGAQYKNGPRIPDMTYLDLFKEGNSQAMDKAWYWSSSESRSDTSRAYVVGFTYPGREGGIYSVRKPYPDNPRTSVRPVRRVVF